MTDDRPAVPERHNDGGTTAGEITDESTWAQPPGRGRTLVLAVVASAATITVLLPLPLPDEPRRWLVRGLLVIMAGCQVTLAVRAWRAGRRPLSPRSLRLANLASWMLGLMAGGMYAVPAMGYQSAGSSLLVGAATALAFAGLMWFSDPARAPKPSPPREQIESLTP